MLTKVLELQNSNPSKSRQSAVDPHVLQLLHLMGCTGSCGRKRYNIKRYFRCMKTLPSGTAEFESIKIKTIVMRIGRNTLQIHLHVYGRDNHILDLGEEDASAGPREARRRRGGPATLASLPRGILVRSRMNVKPWPPAEFCESVEIRTIVMRVDGDKVIFCSPSDFQKRIPDIDTITRSIRS